MLPERGAICHDIAMVRIVKKAEERRAEIVKTAGHLFRTKKYEKTTMQDVMDTLKIAKGTIYHYFKSKEELLEAVVEDLVNTNMAQMKAAMKEIKGDALTKIKALMDIGNMATNEEDLLNQLHKGGNEALHIRLLAATLTRQAALYAELIEQGCREGIFQTDTPRECAEFILSAFQFLTDIGIYPWSQAEIERRIKAFPIIAETLLNAPKGSFNFLIERMQ